MLDKLGMAVTINEAEYLVNEVDVDSKGFLNFPKFIDLIF